MAIATHDGQVVTVPAELRVIVCGHCTGAYAIAERFAKDREQNGGEWHCPYCQAGTAYIKTENQRLRDEIETRKRWAEADRAAHEETRKQLATAESRRRAEKAAKTRLKKRAAGGVCPCCSRTFKQLAQHMAAMHPEFVQEAKVEAKS